jgi:hypothetical protein
MLADDLRIIRMQVTLFRTHHRGVPAGYPDLDESAAPTEAAFMAQMTSKTQANGDAPADGQTDGVYGPYFSSFPVNPINDKSSVNVIADNADFPDAASGSDGWVYKPATLEVRADCIGSDEMGKDFFDY